MADLAKDISSSFLNNHIKALINILYTANYINSKQVLFFKPYGLSPQQYNILRILRGAKQPLRAQTVKNRMIQRSPNATRLMDKLCKKNLIERLPDTCDKRVIKIIITDLGLKLLKEIDEKVDKNTLSNLTDEEAKHLSDLLDKARK